MIMSTDRTKTLKAKVLSNLQIAFYTVRTSESRCLRIIGATGRVKALSAYRIFGPCKEQSAWLIKLCFQIFTELITLLLSTTHLLS